MNPEFHRHLWLQFSWLKLVSAPVLIGIVVFGLEASGGLSNREISNAAFWVFNVIMGFWATRRAADSLVEEIAGGTWDFQRMSSLSAWQMAWGKILGSTSYAWYCAFWILGMLAWTGAEFDEMPPFAGAPFALILQLTMAALGAQAAAFAASIIIANKATGLAKLSTTLGQFVGLIFYAAFQGGLPLELMMVSREWYGLAIDNLYLFLLTTFVATFWAWVGAFRLMQRELQYAQRPWVYVAFLVALFLYQFGFMQNYRDDFFGVYVSFYLLTYLSFFAERKNPMIVMEWITAVKSARVQKFPLFAFSLTVTIIVLITGAIAAPDSGHKSPTFNWFGEIFGPRALKVSFFVSLLLLFMVRDLLFLTFQNLRMRANADLTGVMILAVLYWPLAALLTWLGGDRLIVFVLPHEQSLWQYAAVLLEIALLLLACRSRLWGVKKLGKLYA